MLLLRIRPENALLSLVLNLYLSRRESASQKGQLLACLLFHTYRLIFSKPLLWQWSITFVVTCSSSASQSVILYKSPGTYLETKHMHLLHSQMKTTSNFVIERCFRAEFILSSSVTTFNEQTWSNLKPNTTTRNFI